jgi:dihydrofolate synthase/folylpolyglutamate synthase
MNRDLADWLRLLEQRHPRTIDLGLERCGRVYRAMGSPRPAPIVITVGGTNGKGSAVAWSCALLEGLGYITAAYTSPHLLEFNERLRLGSALATDAELVTAFARVEAARGDESLTYFEFTTLACLDLMHRFAADVAVLEVGLGGRLDTVNLVDADLALLMPIGLDHMEFLGTDRESIGREKAGILRPRIDLVCGEASPPHSVLQRAAQLECNLLLPGREYHYRQLDDTLEFELSGSRVELPLPVLAGAHQLGNFAAALAAVQLIEPKALQRPEKLAAGMSRVWLAGRLQPSSADPRVVLDVGHNPLAAQVVADFLAARKPAQALVVLGMLADKEAESVAQVLTPWVDGWYCAGLSGARGQGGAELGARISTQAGDCPLQVFADVPAALAAARRDAQSDATILVFGSFQTVADAVRALRDAAAVHNVAS